MDKRTGDVGAPRIEDFFGPVPVAANPVDGAVSDDLDAGAVQAAEAEIPAKRKAGRPKGARTRKPRTAGKRSRSKRARALKALDKELSAASELARAAEKHIDGTAEPSAAPMASPVAAAVPTLSDADMAELVGLMWYGLGHLMPTRMGGGDLPMHDRELLGKAWYAYLKPKLDGEGGPLGIAIAATVQVFFGRAIVAAAEVRAAGGHAGATQEAAPSPVDDDEPATPARSLRTPPNATNPRKYRALMQ